MTTRFLLVATMWFFLATLPAAGDEAAPLSALAKMPVKEVTVFKDGHAFVLHAGKMPTDAAGNVVMDYLPTPVLGTFWPYASDSHATLQAVVAEQHRVLVERTALNLPEWIEANVGAEVVVTETAGGKTYSATIVGIPSRRSQELEATSPPNSGEKLPVKGDLVLLKTEVGTKAVKITDIQNILVKDEPKTKLTQEEFRNLLTLKMDWKGKARAEADVGMMYLQKGIRWIPNYKVTLDGKGRAAVKLQATLINELADLEDVTCHLVIGVPTFRFEQYVDPISAQGQIAQLSQYFRRDSQTAYALGRAIMSQVSAKDASAAVGGDMRSGATAGGPALDLGPEVAGSGQAEDLFVFEVRHVTLKKGERMVLPVTEFTIPYKDVYTLDVPFAPPPEVWGDVMNYYRGRFGESGDPEVARLFHAPKVMHKIRLTNKSEFPLTTAPALILRDDRVLAQGLLQYTPIGSETDLGITTAMNIRVEKEDKETARTPNAVNWQGNSYAQVDLAGVLKLTNRGDKAAELEVTRYVLGNVLSADHDGKTEMVNAMENPAYLPSGSAAEPSWYWWHWYNWPHWWYHFNGIGKISWKVQLDPGESIDLNYTWNYYWR